MSLLFVQSPIDKHEKILKTINSVFYSFFGTKMWFFFEPVSRILSFASKAARIFPETPYLLLLRKAKVFDILSKFLAVTSAETLKACCSPAMQIGQRIHNFIKKNVFQQVLLINFVFQLLCNHNEKKRESALTVGNIIKTDSDFWTTSLVHHFY